jgi:hypothetical protein
VYADQPAVLVESLDHVPVDLELAEALIAAVTTLLPRFSSSPDANRISNFFSRLGEPMSHRPTTLDPWISERKRRWPE